MENGEKTENGGYERPPKYKKEWTVLDYWFHVGVAINIFVVLLILWFTFK